MQMSITVEQYKSKGGKDVGFKTILTYIVKKAKNTTRPTVGSELSEASLKELIEVVGIDVIILPASS